MRTALVIAALAAVGCNNDPCNGVTGVTCITLHVTSARVMTLEQIAVGSSIDGGKIKTDVSPSSVASPPETFTLPFDMALKYGLSEHGHVELAALAAVSGNFTADGATSFDLVSGKHLTVTLMLDGAPPVFDMATPSTPDLANPPNPDMGAPPLNLLVAGSFASMSSSPHLLATVTQTGNTLQIYDLPSGTLKVTLDSNVAPSSFRVSDNWVVYCVNPTAIGTTGSKSCTLKLWRPGDTSGTQLGSGVFPFSSINPLVSSDGTVLAWTENVDATATKADVVTWFAGTKTTAAAQMTLANAGGLIFNNVIFGFVPGTMAGQFDIARSTAPATTVHICQNCDQLVMKNDGTMIAARALPSANLGKLVVAPSSINTVNGLGMSAMGSPTADVTRLIDYFDAGSVMYFSASGGGFNIREWTSSNNTVATRLADGSAQGYWNDNGSLLLFYKTLDANSVGDLWLLTAATATAPTFFDSGGSLYDLTSDGRFTFTKEPSTTVSTWSVEVGDKSGLKAPLTAPSNNGRIINPTRVGYFSGTSWDITDYVSGTTFSAKNVIEYSNNLSLNRVLLLFSGSPADGIYMYSF